MIVPSMSCVEIAREFILDYNSVWNKADHLAKVLRREAIKTKTRKVIKFYPYTSLRSNNWIIIIEYLHPKCAVITAVHYLNNAGSFNLILSYDISAFHHFSSHFLVRYNERFLNRKDLSKLEIFKLYILNNNYSTAKYLESNHVYLKIKDGYVLGISEEINEEIEIIHYITFLSNDMILDYQKEDVNFLTKQFKNYFEEHPGEKKIHF
jgi:hypothetical protein